MSWHDPEMNSGRTRQYDIHTESSIGRRRLSSHLVRVDLYSVERRVKIVRYRGAESSSLGSPVGRRIMHPDATSRDTRNSRLRCKPSSLHQEDEQGTLVQHPARSSILLSTAFSRALHSILWDQSVSGYYSTRARHLQAPRQTAVCRFGVSFLTISAPIARPSILLIPRFASGAATEAESGAP